MRYIRKTIQDGFMTRRGFRGRLLTLYLHVYSGATEVTERFHNHPWRFAFGIVLFGGMCEQFSLKPSQWPDYAKTSRVIRPPLSIQFYTPDTWHRVESTLPGTVTVFFGVFRTQKRMPSAAVLTAEGFAHWSEV